MRGFDINSFYEDREVCVGDDVKEFTCLLTIINLWPGYWENQLDQMKKKVNEKNDRWGTQDYGRFWELLQFSRKKFWKNIGCLLSAPTFGIGGSRLWEKDPKISGKKRKRLRSYGLGIGRIRSTG